MAEAVIERTSKKVERSLGRGRTVKERAKNWDEVNKAAADQEIAADEAGARDSGEGGEGEGEGDGAENGWETDEDMEPAQDRTNPAATQPAGMPPRDGDDDEIL